MLFLVFEDSHHSTLSTFYRSAYIGRQSDLKFEYANSSDNLMNKIDEIANLNPDSKIFAFVDLIPDNRKTVSAFTKLWNSIAHVYAGRAICFPTVCAEYNLLKTIQSTDLILDKYRIDIDKCISLIDYPEVKSRYKKHVTNLEQLCKHFSQNALVKCASLSTSKSERMYYYSDCKCISPAEMNVCRENTLVSKALEYVCTYSHGTNLADFDFDISTVTKCIKYIDTYLEKFNELVCRYKELHPDEADKYNLINIRKIRRSLSVAYPGALG